MTWCPQGRIACIIALATAFGASPVQAQQNDSTQRTLVTGYLTTSYTASARNADAIIVGRLYGRLSNQFMINTATVTVQRAAATSGWSAGFLIEPTVGQNAAVVKSAGLDLGPDADLWQAYAVLNIPTSRTRVLQLRMGKMATLMGVEVFEDVLNPTFEVGTQDILLEPFTETGAELDYHVDGHVDFEGRITNGWDAVVDNNRGQSIDLRAAWTPSGATTVAVVGYTGPEQTNDTRHYRSGIDVVASQMVAHAMVWLQLDAGHEAGAAHGSREGAWRAAGVWGTMPIAPTITLGFRLDAVDDRDGTRTSGQLGYPVNDGLTLYSATGSLTLRRWPHALIRGELRYDHASLPVFGPNVCQWSATVATSYLL